MPDNARDIIDLLRGRHLTEAEANRIIQAALDRIQVPRQPVMGSVYTARREADLKP